MNKLIPEWLNIPKFLKDSDPPIPLIYWPKANDTQKFVGKSWGYERWIINTPLYCGKILFIETGKQTSWHYHEKKDECMYVLSGTLNLQHDWERPIYRAGNAVLKEGDSFHIPTGMTHRLHAWSAVTLFEFSTHHEDDDSIRLKDDGTPL